MIRKLRIYYNLLFYIILVISNTIISCDKNEQKTSVTKFDYLPTSTSKSIVKHKYYTLSYKEPFEQAEWVAYKLKREQIVYTKLKRPFFEQDPKVKTGSADWKNYKNSGYSRGHLLPAADRKYNRTAYNETFLTSNISPQKYDFNAGVWNRLEQKTRYWAQKYDQLYVITGGVLSENLKTIGYEKVAVPKYFYKILLHKTKSKTKAIAFLVPHNESNRPLFEFVVTIDQIEKLTSIDFFSALPDALENTLESSSDYKDWSFK